MGAAWGIAVIGMTAVLLVVFIRRLRTTGEGSGRLVATGVVIGLAVVGIGLLAARLS
jgi:hypothetical protein